jgi:hypothetical protein
MTLGKRDPSRIDAAIVPFVALGFSILVALLAPRYAGWFDRPLPVLTSYYLAWWPVWIVLNTLAVVVQKSVKAMKLHTYEGGFWRKADAILGALSVLSVIVGVIAIVLPAVHARPF